MTADVVQLFATEADVDAAWEALRRHSAQIVENPKLLCDREFIQEQIRRHEKFKRLFMAQEAGK